MDYWIKTLKNPKIISFKLEAKYCVVILQQNLLCILILASGLRNVFELLILSQFNDGVLILAARDCWEMMSNEYFCSSEKYEAWSGCHSHRVRAGVFNVFSMDWFRKLFAQQIIRNIYQPAMMQWKCDFKSRDGYKWMQVKLYVEYFLDRFICLTISHLYSSSSTRSSLHYFIIR